MPSVRLRQTLVAAVAQPLAFAPAVILWLAAAHRLPDPVATHFGAFGAADGFIDRSSVVSLTLGFGAGLGLLFGAVAWFGSRAGAARGSGFDGPRWLAGWSWSLAAFVGAVWFGIAFSNLDLAAAAAATLPWWTFPLAIVGVLPAGVAGWKLAPASDPGADPVRAAPLMVAAGERVAWSRQTGATWMFVAAIGLGVSGIGFGFALDWLLGGILITTGVIAAWLSRARVTVDARGLTVAIGPFGFPRVHIPADDIEEATTAEVAAMQYGGWGYRVVPGGHGLILRSGEALLVRRRSSGARFTVTVDDATTAARLLTTYAGVR